MKRRLLFLAANGELALCAGLMLASVFYIVIREALPKTPLGRTYGDPWDIVIVLATLASTAGVVGGNVTRRPLMRALGLIGVCTLVLLIDLTYFHLRGFAPAAYAILSNAGIVVWFGATAWLIVTGGGRR